MEATSEENANDNTDPREECARKEEMDEEDAPRLSKSSISVMDIDNKAEIKNERTVEKRSKKLATLLVLNEEILKKLEQVRQTKAYEMMKYKTIENMTATKVGEYLRSEMRRPTAVKSSEAEQTRKKFREQLEDKAAVVLQNYMRKIVTKKKAERRAKRWRVEDPRQRVRLISEVSARLYENNAPYRTDLSAIKAKLEDRKNRRCTSALAYEARESLMDGLERNLNFFQQYHVSQ